MSADREINSSSQPSAGTESLMGFIVRRRPSRWRTIENNVCLQLIGKIIIYIYSSLYIIKSYARWNDGRAKNKGKQQNNIGTMTAIGETA